VRVGLIMTVLILTFWIGFAEINKSLRFARNDKAIYRHCEERSDEAIQEVLIQKNVGLNETLIRYRYGSIRKGNLTI